MSDPPPCIRWHDQTAPGLQSVSCVSSQTCTRRCNADRYSLNATAAVVSPESTFTRPQSVIDFLYFQEIVFILAFVCELSECISNTAPGLPTRSEMHNLFNQNLSNHQGLAIKLMTTLRVVLLSRKTIYTAVFKFSWHLFPALDFCGCGKAQATMF